MNKGAQILLAADQRVQTPRKQSYYDSSQGSPYGTPRTKANQNIMQGNGLEVQEANHLQPSSVECIIQGEHNLEEVEYHMTDIDEVASIADNSMIQGNRSDETNSKHEINSLNNLNQVYRKDSDFSYLRHSVIQQPNQFPAINPSGKIQDSKINAANISAVRRGNHFKEHHNFDLSMISNTNQTPNQTPREDKEINMMDQSLNDSMLVFL